MSEEVDVGPAAFGVALKAAKELTAAINAAQDVGVEIDVVLEEFKVRDQTYKQVMVYVLSVPS